MNSEISYASKRPRHNGAAFFYWRSVLDYFQPDSVSVFVEIKLIAGHRIEIVLVLELAGAAVGAVDVVAYHIVVQAGALAMLAPRTMSGFW